MTPTSASLKSLALRFSLVAFALALTSATVAAQQLIATIPTDNSPYYAAVTRLTAGWFSGTIGSDVINSVCEPPDTAEAYVFNATVVPVGPLGYLSLWPNGESQPMVSTLNAGDGSITSNMAIVPTANGSIDAFASNPTQLILDMSSYFAP